MKAKVGDLGAGMISATVYKPERWLFLKKLTYL